MFSVDLIHCIVESIDKDDKATQFKAACLSKTWMEVTFSHFPELQQAPHHVIAKVLEQRQVIPWLILDRVDFQVNSWENLLYWSQDFQRRFMEKRLIRTKDVAQSKLPIKWRTQKQALPAVADYRTLVLPQILYRIWHSMFTKVIEKDITKVNETSTNGNAFQTDTVLPSAQPSIGGGIVTMLPTLISLMNTGARGKTKLPELLNELTQYILTEYRRDLRIDEKFIECCFRNKLEKTLYHLMDYRKHYHFRLPEDQTLEETYMLMAAKCDDIDIFCNMLALVEMTISQFTWITRNAPIGFLLSMIKVRKSIPRFNMMVQFLDENLETKSWKQEDFFKRVKEKLI